jgi:hypothetical protein
MSKRRSVILPRDENFYLVRREFGAAKDVAGPTCLIRVRAAMPPAPADRPLPLRLPTSCCFAANRRSGPKPVMFRGRSQSFWRPGHSAGCRTGFPVRSRVSTGRPALRGRALWSRTVRIPSCPTTYHGKPNRCGTDSGPWLRPEVEAFQGRTLPKIKNLVRHRKFIARQYQATATLARNSSTSRLSSEEF